MKASLLTHLTRSRLLALPKYTSRALISTEAAGDCASKPIINSISPPPWELPPQTLQAKRFSASDSAEVKRQLGSFDPSVPIEHASMPPSSWYLSDSFMRAEMGAIFSNSWQFVCRSDQVDLPGKYIATYSANGEPVLVTRSSDGKLRAFANVCRHHAARVADGCGVASEFVCPYHSWTYNDKGRLTKATRLKGIKGFSAGKTALTPLEVEQWGPLVFVSHRSSQLVESSSRKLELNSGEQRDQANQVDQGNHPMYKSVTEQLKPVAVDMDRLLPLGEDWNNGGWKGLHHLNRRIYNINCNWKVYCDNYLDGGYHIEHLHKGLFNELDMPSYKTELYDAVSIQGVKSKSSRVGSDAVYAFMFPNLAINRYGDWLDTNLVVPVSPDKCVIIFDWYHTGASPTHDPEHNRSLIDSLDQSKNIQDEDVAISESVQCGIGSSTYDRGRYAPTVEHAELHFHRLIHRAVSEHIGNSSDGVNNN